MPDHNIDKIISYYNKDKKNNKNNQYLHHSK